MQEEETKAALARIESRLSELDQALRAGLKEQLLISKYGLAFQLSMGAANVEEGKKRIHDLKQIVAELEKS